MLSLSFNTSLIELPARLILRDKFPDPFIGWGVISYLILWFQRNEERLGPWLATAVINRHGAYILHSLVLAAALLEVSFIGINPWLIAITVTALSIAISFEIADQLRRIPAIARVL